jgi:hypothetical protein
MMSEYEEEIQKKIGLAVMQMHSLNKTEGNEEKLANRATFIETLLFEWDKHIDDQINTLWKSFTENHATEDIKKSIETYHLIRKSY